MIMGEMPLYPHLGISRAHAQKYICLLTYIGPEHHESFNPNPALKPSAGHSLKSGNQDARNNMRHPNPSELNPKTLPDPSTRQTAVWGIHSGDYWRLL